MNHQELKAQLESSDNKIASTDSHFLHQQTPIFKIEIDYFKGHVIIDFIPWVTFVQESTREWSVIRKIFSIDILREYNIFNPDHQEILFKQSKTHNHG